ncbi:MAG TPA: hypothetical protein VEJ47_18745 [Candidatus Eremiobacteraceae bacterium]|nr:hypothetical protein [Candidatus Eremiobacteraceae bacterium]
MRHRLVVLTIFLAGFTVAAQTHPSLEGTWVMDKARSQYPAESLIEIIHQHGDAIDISTTEQSPGHANPPMQLHLTTDGKPATNTVGPNTFISRSHWSRATW